MVDNQLVEQTSSVNLAMATNELGRLPQTLEVAKIQALLKAAQVQVNDIRNPAPSFSTASARSCHPRGSRQEGEVFTTTPNFTATRETASTSRGGLEAISPSTPDRKHLGTGMAD